MPFLEVIVTSVIASLTGLGVLTSKFNKRLDTLDNKMDAIELSVAKDYVSKDCFNTIIERVESHMVRIETKLDNIIIQKK
jgi:bacterioferritin (cytochrome b1)|tara:strand:+ start:1223 stop:1462 length:240 start_codon:yes stop_codon:yes gene_type:complete